MAGRPSGRKRREDARRRQQRAAARDKQEAIHQRSRGGGQTNELGALEGQNAEQGNTADHRYAVELGKHAH